MSDKNNKNIRKNIENYEKKLKMLEKEHKVAPVVTIEFPQYKILPPEVQLALKVLEVHKYKLMLSYTEVNNGH